MSRPDNPKTIVIKYNGVEYAKYDGRNYYLNRRDRSAPNLHQQIYIDNNGDIPDGYHVHHIDGNPENNAVDNLVAIPPEEHIKETAKQMWKTRAVTKKCAFCGNMFETIYDGDYCSKKCRRKRWNRDHKDYYKQYHKNYRLKIKGEQANA